MLVSPSRLTTAVAMADASLDAQGRDGIDPYRAA
jgi:hypothetical protein